MARIRHELNGTVGFRRLRAQAMKYGVLWCILLLCVTAGPVVVQAQTERPQLRIGHYFMFDGTGDMQEASARLMHDIVNEFAQLHPEIEVVEEPYQYVSLTDGKMLIQLLLGDAPTVWLVPNVYVFSFSDLLVDLTDRAIQSEVIQTEFLPGVLQANADPQGRIWGIPQGIQLRGLFFHEDRFAESGVAIPTLAWTWDDFAEGARKLTRYGPIGLPELYGAIVQAGHPHTGWAIFRSFGGHAFDATGTVSTLDSDAMVRAIRYMKQGVDSRVFLYSAPADLQNTAMNVDTYTRMVNMQTRNVPFGVTAVPSGPYGRFVPAVANSWVISSSATPEEQDAAWKWIEFYSSVPVQVKWALSGEAAPANMRAAVELASLTGPSVPMGFSDFVESMQHLDWIGVNPVWTDWVAAWTRPVDQAVLGAISPEEAALQANHAAQVVLDSYYVGE